ncbi:MAG: D-alanyl-D-alanine carboxypeptidase/D-alanyl-D-alanine-endopeptidase, partial [Schaalia georgiae]|nr:D-alanyl-D-alanine carboxypeptidase/D-alanyl-D-alanine-endopeptidase [Schaalia georgiae]
AARAAEALKGQGVSSARVDWRGSLFEGEAHLGAWDAQEVGNYAGAVGAIAIDAGRTEPQANSFHQDPALRAAEVFAAALESNGVATDLGSAAAAPQGAASLASVESATMGQQIRWMLHHSDNTVADQYCHLAAAAASAPTTFAGSVGNLVSTLTSAGVPTDGLNLEDCSGLSSNDRLTARTLVGVLRAAMSSSNAGARDLIESLPWAGLQGTLTTRFTDPPAVGNVQAKTGSLAAVASLSGVLTTQGGRTLVVAVGVQDPAERAVSARGLLDSFEEGLVSLN